MPCISIPTAMLISGGLAAAGGVASGVIGANASKQAASVQANAANQQSANQLTMFNTEQQNLQPFISGGAGAFGQLQQLTGTNAGGNPLTSYLTQPFNPTMEQLAQTPGYQFALKQGMLAAQNGFAAQGLGESGAAIRGGIDYAEGLASETYQQQFDNNLKQKQSIFNMLGGMASTGENAAAGVMNAGMTAQNAASQIALGGANSTASGIVGGANALTGGINSAVGGIGNAATIMAMNNAGMFAKPTPTPTAPAVNSTGYNLLFGGNP